MFGINDDTVSLQRETDVVHITAAAGEQLPVFDARQGLAEFCTAHRYGMVNRRGGEFGEFGAVGNGSMTPAQECRPFVDLERSVKYQLYCKIRRQPSSHQ